MADMQIAVRPLRYEVEQRPSTIGGGWRLDLIGADIETGEPVCAASGIFPEREDDSEIDAKAIAVATGESWVASFVA